MFTHFWVCQNWCQQMPPRGPDAKTTSYMLTDPELETWDFFYLWSRFLFGNKFWGTWFTQRFAHINDTYQAMMYSLTLYWSLYQTLGGQHFKCSFHGRSLNLRTLDFFFVAFSLNSRCIEDALGAFVYFHANSLGSCCNGASFLYFFFLASVHAYEAMEHFFFFFFLLTV